MAIAAATGSRGESAANEIPVCYLVWVESCVGWQEVPDLKVGDAVAVLLRDPREL